MQRHRSYQTFILDIYPIGEMHSGCLILTREQGLLRAMAYGLRASKSKLRASVFLFARGKCELYTRGEQRSIRSFDAQASYTEIRMAMYRFFYASLWAEILCRSHFGHDNCEEVFDLVVQSFDIIEQADQATAMLLDIHFLWRYLQFMGERPELRMSGSSIMYYQYIKHEFVSVQEADSIPLPVSAINYLQENGRRGLTQAVAISCKLGDAEALSGFLHQLIQHILGRRLNTLKVLPDPSQ